MHDPPTRGSIAWAVVGVLCLALVGCAGGAGRVSGEMDPVVADLGGLDPEIADELTRYLDAARAAPVDATRRVALGAAYEQANLLRAALASYRQAAELDPEQPRHHYYIALTQAGLGQLQQALESIDATLDREPQYLPALLYRGAWLLDLGRVDEALATYRGALEVDPGDTAARTGLARVHLKQGDAAGAVAILEPMVASSPHQAHLQQLLGLAYRGVGRIDDAQRALAQGRPTSRPGWPDPWSAEKTTLQAGFGAGLRRAEALLNAGQAPDALVLLEALRPTRPTDRPLLNNLSIAYRRVGRDAEALQTLLDGLEHHPDYFPFHLNLAAAYERQGDLDGALRHLARVIEINPGLATAHQRKAGILMRTRRFPEALDAFETALRYEGSDKLSLLYSGMILAELQRWEPARQRLEQAVEADPGSSAGYLSLALVLAELKQFDAADAALARSEQLEPQSRRLAPVRERIRQQRAGG